MISFVKGKIGQTRVKIVYYLIRRLLNDLRNREGVDRMKKDGLL